MTLENQFLLISLLFLVVYVMRYKDELPKRIGILCVGSAVCYAVVYLLLLRGNGFSLYQVSQSMLLFTALDQLLYYALGAKRKK